MDTRGNLKIQKAIKFILPHYIHHKIHIGKGEAELMSLRHIIQMAFLAKIAYDWLPIWSCVVLVVGYIILCKGVGWTWDKNKGYDMEANWNNVRNPFVRNVERKLK